VSPIHAIDLLTDALPIGHSRAKAERHIMATTRDPENMSYAELIELRARVDRLMAQKKTGARAELRAKIAQMAKAQGMRLEDVLGDKRASRGRNKGVVAIKYRDPNNPSNTWTGRGKIPRWMTAAMQDGKAKKEDFLL
jgi:DNA-binding protein H-NS